MSSTSNLIPQPAHPRPLEAFWLALTHFDRKKVNVWMGLRNALGIALPLALGVVFDQIGSGLLAATGALNVAAGDGLDSYRNRAERMLTSSFVVAAAVFIGSLAGRNPAALVTMTVLWGFAAGFVVSLGVAAADIGMISLVVIIIYGAQSMTPQHAALAGLIALGGGLLQTALSILFWPIRGLRPERRLIGEFYEELAVAATTEPNPYGAPLASQATTQAREALAAVAGDHRVDAERLFLLVSQAERIRLSLFALNRARVRLRRKNGGAQAALIDQFLGLTAHLLSATGRSLYSAPLLESVSLWLKEAEDLAEVLRKNVEETTDLDIRPHLAEARLQMDALVGQLRAAAELAGNTTISGEKVFQDREAHTPWHLRLGGWVATLRANFTLESSACRHAIRMALCMAIGDVIARSFALPRSYWLAMTVALVLKPDFGNTFSRGVLRLAGTYTGLVLATVLFHFISPSPGIRVLWIGILAFLQLSVGRANYGILVTVISGLVVLLFSLSGIEPKELIAARAVNTTIGGALALVIYAVWPTRERTQVPHAMASMLDTYRLYFQAISRAYIDGRSVAPHELDRLRLNGRLARSNVETSVDRLSAEPYVVGEQLHIANAILASSHRFIHAGMALEAGLVSGAAPELDSAEREALRTFSYDVEKALYYLATRFRGSRIPAESLPNLREDHHRLVRSCDRLDGHHAMLHIEADRMTNSLNTLAEQVYAWAALMG